MTNVVEFKKRDKEEKEVKMQEEERQSLLNQIVEVKENFLNTIDKKEEDLMDSDSFIKALQGLTDEGIELSFRTESEALVFATTLLSLPEYEDVSHFEVVSNISRKSVFLTLQPVFKEEEVKFMFPAEELIQSANLLNINKEVERLEE
jgi:arginine decarboxylase-like protein